ncbi:hypothetical protein GCK32_008991 [Trichostrongylus colubriformis]
MLHFRALILAILISVTTIGASDEIIRSGPLPNAFNVPFRVFGKRNQLYGLFKKLNLESPEPVYMHGGFGSLKR